MTISPSSSYLPSAGETLATGMRLSTPCPTQRLREFIEPETYMRPFPEWAATLGHLIEAHVINTILKPAAKGGTLHPQYAIQWWGGISHDDCMIEGGPLTGLHEIKSTSKTTPIIDNDWITQLQRRLALLDNPLDTKGHIWVAHKPEDWQANLVLRGPYVVRVTTDDVDRVHAELDAMREWWDHYQEHAETIDLATDAKLKQLCEAYGCGRCVRGWFDIDDPKLDELLRRHAAGEDVKAEIRSAAPAGTRYKSTATGYRLVVTEPQQKYRTCWDDALAARVEGLETARQAAEKAGFVVDATPTPQVRIKPLADED